MQAQTDQIALPLRPHTILGVCEAVGEDFGFSPNWLRILFAASVLFSPTMAIGAYLALGAVVLASRLLFPTTPATAATPAQTISPEVPANDPATQKEMSIAA